MHTKYSIKPLAPSQMYASCERITYAKHENPKWTLLLDRCIWVKWFEGLTPNVTWFFWIISKTFIFSIEEIFLIFKMKRGGLICDRTKFSNQGFFSRKSIDQWCVRNSYIPSQSIRSSLKLWTTVVRNLNCICRKFTRHHLVFQFIRSN